MSDRFRFGLGFTALLAAAALTSHFWALDQRLTALASLGAGVVVFALLLWSSRSPRQGNGD